MTGYLDASAIRRLAAELDLRPSKQRGQNFVIDANTVRRIAVTAGVGPGDRVLEIGPGLGSLTAGLLAAGAAVTAVEIEPALARRLPVTLAGLGYAADRFEVVEADALAWPTAGPAGARPEPTHLVANLPYNVAVPVLLHALAAFPGLQSGLVMVQLEVADRLVAAPGSKVYGTPSAKLAWYADATKAGSVGANVFWPKPNVESGLVRFTRRDPPATTATREAVFAVVDAAFAQRRKMLRSALAARYGAAASLAALAAAGLDPTARGETLGIADFARLAAHLPA
ncbi:MAG: 16S rRNA (adenine(1518)-N(6)/adenine(1519)-N(6))-dimethyltransferase RsmA [Propionibacteriaceae bacterium]|nr:16S rRNA (adenine(1518)-N(6)/adenine(1519)-N(6))-dimethyltransferase RsmA [Propionibacteriaceae bacterium]